MLFVTPNLTIINFPCTKLGQDWKEWQTTVSEFLSHSPGSVPKPGVAALKQSPSATLFGKLNFKNQAQKDVKIYEVSGIGEPTVLSPNYVSTFFVKSSRPSASFRAEDPRTHEKYLLNGKNVFKVSLSQSPTSENDVIITEDAVAAAARRTSDKPSKK